MSFPKNYFYRLRTEAHRQDALARLRKLETRLVSPQARFAVPFAFRGKGFFKTIAPRQNGDEIESLYRAVLALGPRRVLEIGTARGGSLYLWTQAATQDAVLVSVDLPGGEFGGAYPPCREAFYRAFARPGQTLHLFRLDSHRADTKSMVQRAFGERAVDFAFIDGDHTYEGVMADFRDYGPLVRPGGLIAFHDILPRPDMPGIQVDRFWNEIRGRHDCQELIGREGSGRRIGIGMLRVREGDFAPGAPAWGGADA
jgi:predicted O-methyltransferase YrrM